MSRRDEIVRRIQFVNEQLSALAQLVEQLEIGVSVAEPPPAVAAVVAAPRPVAPEPLELLSKPRWSYQPGASYRIVGVNPFRSDGNNFALFNHLVERFGEAPFSFERLTATIDELRADGTVDTDQTTDSFLRVFLRQGGLEKHRIAMASVGRAAASPPVTAAPAAPAPVKAPAPTAPSGRPRRPVEARSAAPAVSEVSAEPVRRAPPVLRRRASEVVPVGSSGAPAAPAASVAPDDLPPEAGDDASPAVAQGAPSLPDGGASYQIVRPPTFRGDTATRRIAEVLGQRAFSRGSVTALVREMCADGRLVARRPVPLLVDDLLKVLREQGVLSET